MSTRLANGTLVRVKELFPPGHCRTPYYTRGRSGVVLGLADVEGNPEELAYGRQAAPLVPVYRVEFDQATLWPDYAGPPTDTVVVEIAEAWLEPISGRPGE